MKSFELQSLLRMYGWLLLVAFIFAVIARIITEYDPYWVFSNIVLLGILIPVALQLDNKYFNRVTAALVILVIFINLLFSFYPRTYDALARSQVVSDVYNFIYLRPSSEAEAFAYTSKWCDEEIKRLNNEYSKDLQTSWKSNRSVQQKVEDVKRRKKILYDELKLVDAICSEIPDFTSNWKQKKEVNNEGQDAGSSERAVNTKSNEANSKFVVTVPANQPWTSTGINVTGKTVNIQRISGNWNNVNDKYDQQGQGLGGYPGTVTNVAGIGALIAKTDNGIMNVGTGTTISNSKGELLLGMNEVPGKYGDNHGSLTLEISFY